MNNLVNRNTTFYPFFNQNIITYEECKKITFKFLVLLSNQIKRYTGELRSSVPIIIAKNINESNMWVIGLYLRKMKISDGINFLIENDIDYIYSVAKKQLYEFITKTKLFYEVIFKRNIININNYFYNSTLNDGIKAFFKMYNPDYDAENYIITADYSPYLKVPKLSGIEFISKYLEYINYENIFCKKFNSNKIHKTIKMICPNYEELPINIFETILIISVILEYLNLNVYSLDASNINVFILYNEYTLNSDNFYKNIEKSYNNLIYKMNLNKNTRNYLQQCKKDILSTIKYNTKTSTLEVLLGKQVKKEINCI